MKKLSRIAAAVVLALSLVLVGGLVTRAYAPPSTTDDAPPHWQTANSAINAVNEFIATQLAFEITAGVDQAAHARQQADWVRLQSLVEAAERATLEANYVDELNKMNRQLERTRRRVEDLVADIEQLNNDHADGLQDHN